VDNQEAWKPSRRLAIFGELDTPASCDNVADITQKPCNEDPWTTGFILTLSARHLRLFVKHVEDLPHVKAAAPVNVSSFVMLEPIPEDDEG